MSQIEGNSHFYPSDSKVPVRYPVRQEAFEVADKDLVDLVSDYALLKAMYSEGSGATEAQFDEQVKKVLGIAHEMVEALTEAGRAVYVCTRHEDTIIDWLSGGGWRCPECEIEFMG